MKSIEIDDEAFERLERVRRPKESMSDVVLRLVKAPKTVEEILQALRSAELSDETLDAIDESVERRRNSSRIV